MKPLLILAAVPQELELLRTALESRRSDPNLAWTVTEGYLGEQQLVLCCTGVGKANAAAAAAVMVERYRPSLLIVTGCAGAYLSSGLAVGDLAVASDELFGDEGTLTADGWQGLREMSLPIYRQGNQAFYNTIPLSRHETEKAMQLADSHGVRLMRGRFLTVSTCSGTRAQGQELARRHQAICENMEGAAIALVALRYGLPCLEIRGISNLVEDRDLSRWDIPRAVEAAQRFVIKILEATQRPTPPSDTVSRPIPDLNEER